ncbi:MAG: glycogen/starch synthase [Patescibacteria group bacterium]
MQKQKPKSDYLFEVSFEICNKVGGIYRVLESKAANMVDKYGDNYYLIGPYNLENSKGEFKQQAPSDQLKKVFDELEEEGIQCYFGRWMVKGRPKTILIDFEGYYPQKNEIKKKLWENYGVDSLNAGDTFERPTIWSWASGKLIEKIREKEIGGNEKVVAHFHEWLSGAGLLYLKENSNISTVFTTHATSLGRALAYNDVNFYTKFNQIDPSQASYDRNVHSKHQLEKKTAQHADVFTTVSEITGLETEKFLGRKPDIILPNGLNLDKFLTFEEIVIKHRLQRRRLREFTISHFFPYYKFDIENTLFYFIIGRNEYKAKGVDVFIKSLSELNERLKKDDDNDKTIVAYFWIPSNVRSVKRELVENKEFFNDVKDSLNDAMPQVEERILYDLIHDKEITKENIISENYLFEIEKKMLRLNRKSENPPISTHEIENGEDRILNTLKEHGLTNKEEDPVKVVYYPIYLTGHDGLSNLSYQEALEACHLGVFPSFYEPWGYTPLEAAALGVASVTTDLAGFGRYRQTLKEKPGKEGVYVLERYKQSDSRVVNDLAEFMHKFSQFNRQGRVDNKIEARKIASKADWDDFVENYIEAHNKSLQ